MNSNLLEIKNLKTYFHTEAGIVKAVDGVDFHIKPKETLGVVGESGCGKSVTSLSVMRLISKPGKIMAGEINYLGENLLEKSDIEMRKIRGNKISMIFQEPMTSLNPVHTIGQQITEALILHQKLSKEEARAKAIKMLELVGLSSPELRVDEYPHQQSGGMRQRVMIAMALSCNPNLLIADEPTTALDVTVQAQILELIMKLKDELDAAVMIITHDLGVVAEMADNVVVLYAGKVVEYSNAENIFKNPLHPYTSELLKSIPRLSDEQGKKLFPIKGSIPNPLDLPTGCKFHPRCNHAIDYCAKNEPPLITLENSRQVRCWRYEQEIKKQFVKKKKDVVEIVPPNSERVVAETKEKHQIILEAKNLVKYFPITGGVFQKVVGHVKAVDDVSFKIMKGETLGIVGESGCGKTTTGRLLLNLIKATSGNVHFEGENIYSLNSRQLQEVRKHMQIIFQDPFSSLNPRLTIGETVGEPFIVHKHLHSRKVISEKVAELLELVGLSADHMFRYPHQFSGGQRQRIGIARAIALNPKLIVCDEPVSALDVSIQAQIINLLEDLQGRFGLTTVFIAHDLSVVKHISDRVAVMYLGKIVEMSTTDNVFLNPEHPYTKALLSAVPIPDFGQKKDRIILQGDVPSPSNPPKGCHFHTRCMHCMDICKKKEPPLIDIGKGHYVACHLKS